MWLLGPRDLLRALIKGWESAWSHAVKNRLHTMKPNAIALVGSLMLATGIAFQARAEVVQHEFADFTGFMVNVPCAAGGLV